MMLWMWCSPARAALLDVFLTTTTSPRWALLTEALVGSLGGATRPRPVLVEGLAVLAVGAGRVVLAHAHQPSCLIRRALAGVTIAFTPAGNPSCSERC